MHLQHNVSIIGSLTPFFNEIQPYPLLDESGNDRVGASSEFIRVTGGQTADSRQASEESLRDDGVGRVPVSIPEPPHRRHGVQVGPAARIVEDRFDVSLALYRQLRV